MKQNIKSSLGNFSELDDAVGLLSFNRESSESKSVMRKKSTIEASSVALPMQLLTKISSSAKPDESPMFG